MNTRTQAAAQQLATRPQPASRTYSLSVPIDNIPDCATVTVRDAQYHAHAEPLVLKRVSEIYREFRPILRLPSRHITGVLLDAWHSWQHTQLDAEIGAIYSMLLGTNQLELTLHYPASGAARARAKLCFLSDLILQVRHDEDRLQFCPA